MTLGIKTGSTLPPAPRLFCHRLSGYLFQKPSSLVTDQPMVTTMECQGPKCAAFVMLEHKDGQIRGACADSIQAVALLRLSELVEAFVEGEGEDDPDDDDVPTEGKA